MIPGVHEDIRRALLDAIGWQESLIDAYRNDPDGPEAREAREQLRRYKAILKRRYGRPTHEARVHTRAGGPRL
jgi:hypothetical protein